MKSEHKIQSGKGSLVLEMDQVPKILKPMVDEWTPEGFIVSFKVGLLLILFDTLAFIYAHLFFFSFRILYMLIITDYNLLTLFLVPYLVHHNPPPPSFS